MDTDEFESVEDHFLSTMPTAEVTQIVKTASSGENTWICKSREMNDFGGGVLNEKLLYHGSGKNKPEPIYEGDTSFDMRFSRRGMWGCGNYFAANV